MLEEVPADALLEDDAYAVCVLALEEPVLERRLEVGLDEVHNAKGGDEVARHVHSLFRHFSLDDGEERGIFPLCGDGEVAVERVGGGVDVENLDDLDGHLHLEGEGGLLCGERVLFGGGVRDGLVGYSGSGAFIGGGTGQVERTRVLPPGASGKERTFEHLLPGGRGGG